MAVKGAFVASSGDGFSFSGFIKSKVGSNVGVPKDGVPTDGFPSTVGTATDGGPAGGMDGWSRENMLPSSNIIGGMSAEGDLSKKGSKNSSIEETSLRNPGSFDDSWTPSRYCSSLSS